MQILDPDFEDLILGVDPGQRIGLSVFYYGKEIGSSFHSSVEELVFHIIQVLGGLRAKRKIVKIGNGDMKITTMLNLNFCSSFELEFVDEQKTTLKIKNFKEKNGICFLQSISHNERDTDALSCPYP